MLSYLPKHYRAYLPLHILHHENWYICFSPPIVPTPDQDPRLRHLQNHRVQHQQHTAWAITCLKNASPSLKRTACGTETTRPAENHPPPGMVCIEFFDNNEVVEVEEGTENTVAGNRPCSLVYRCERHMPRNKSKRRLVIERIMRGREQ